MPEEDVEDVLRTIVIYLGTYLGMYVPQILPRYTRDNFLLAVTLSVTAGVDGFLNIRSTTVLVFAMGH